MRMVNETVLSALAFCRSLLQILGDGCLRGGGLANVTVPVSTALIFTQDRPICPREPNSPGSCQRRLLESLVSRCLLPSALPGTAPALPLSSGCARVCMGMWETDAALDLCHCERRAAAVFPRQQRRSLPLLSVGWPPRPTCQTALAAGNRVCAFDKSFTDAQHLGVILGFRLNRAAQEYTSAHKGGIRQLFRWSPGRPGQGAALVLESQAGQSDRDDRCPLILEVDKGIEKLAWAAAVFSGRIKASLNHFKTTLLLAVTLELQQTHPLPCMCAPHTTTPFGGARWRLTEDGCHGGTANIPNAEQLQPQATAERYQVPCDRDALPQESAERKGREQRPGARRSPIPQRGNWRPNAHVVNVVQGGLCGNGERLHVVFAAEEHAPRALSEGPKMPPQQSGARHCGSSAGPLHVAVFGLTGPLCVSSRVRALDGRWAGVRAPERRRRLRTDARDQRDGPYSRGGTPTAQSPTHNRTATEPLAHGDTSLRSARRPLPLAPATPLTTPLRASAVRPGNEKEGKDKIYPPGDGACRALEVIARAPRSIPTGTESTELPATAQRTTPRNLTARVTALTDTGLTPPREGRSFGRFRTDGKASRHRRALPPLFRRAIDQRMTTRATSRQQCTPSSLTTQWRSPLHELLMEEKKAFSNLGGNLQQVSVCGRLHRVSHRRFNLRAQICVSAITISPNEPN
ncbi:hypothetical protein AAFF_G00258160 [Aldrovandia affinis]|uniref:Uncharacterized protein n=1 Tax=Aldrovandia affinis TaxID=143900 RepID=A0AAD7WT80_9TELE|nr:hypothetical protein AAFF_G00258160 [Aldrovandia affinis]